MRSSRRTEEAAGPPARGARERSSRCGSLGSFRPQVASQPPEQASPFPADAFEGVVQEGVVAGRDCARGAVDSVSDVALGAGVLCHRRAPLIRGMRPSKTTNLRGPLESGKKGLSLQCSRSRSSKRRSALPPQAATRSFTARRGSSWASTCWSLPSPGEQPHEDDEVYVVLEGSGVL